MTKIVSCFNARSSGKENGEKIKYIICSYSSSEIMAGHEREICLVMGAGTSLIHLRGELLNLLRHHLTG
jgi:hypothetical protein